MNVDIWGSCVSRDLFGIWEDECGDIDYPITVENFFQNCSVFSQFSCKPKRIITEFDFEGQFIHKFIRKCVINDWNKTVCDILESSTADWLIVDFMGDRSDYISCTFSDSNENYVITDAVGSDNLINALKAKYSDLITEKISMSKVSYGNKIERFASFCKNHYGGRIILIEPIFCNEYLDDTGSVVKKPCVDNRMEIISNLNKEFVKHTSCYVVKCPHNAIGDTLHKWKEYNLHYISEVYHYFYKCVKSIMMGYPSHNDREIELLYQYYCNLIDDIHSGKRCSSNNTVRRSKKAVEQGDIVKAVFILEQLGSNSGATREGELGRLYWKGPKKNFDLSAMHYRQAVSLGNKWAYGELFELLWAIGTPAAYTESFDLAYSGAELGINYSMGDLGRAYRDGKGVQSDLEKAAYWMRKAADYGLWWGKVELFDILWKINTVPALKEMIELIDKYPDDSGYLDVRMGKAYRDGKGVSRDLHQAIRYMRSGVSKGAIWARYDLLDLLQTDNTSESLCEASELCHKYVKKGDGRCAFILGKMYRRGIGVEKNLDESARLLHIAVSNKIWGAEKELFDVLWDSKKQQNFVEMIQLAENGSKSGNTDMIIRLGRLYREGIGVPKDLEKAILCFESSIDKGNGWARIELFDLLSQNSELNAKSNIIDIIKPAALSGNIDAIVRISKAYHHGYGTDVNLDMALNWIKSSGDYNKGWVLMEYFDIAWDLNNNAELSNVIDKMLKPQFEKVSAIQIRLAKAYLNGRGVVQDIEYAKKLLTNALKLGNSEAKKLLIE